MMANFPKALLTAFGMDGVDLDNSGLFQLCLPFCPDLPGDPGRELWVRWSPSKSGNGRRIFADQAGGAHADL
jgi:hypothetical protein